MSITAVIPTREGDELVGRCVDALLAGRRAPNRILIVSDGPASEQLHQIASDCRVTCTVLDSITPQGFSHTVNHGLINCSASLVLVINNDCFVGRECLYRLEKTLSADPLASAVTPLLSDGGRCSIETEHIRRVARLASCGDREEMVSARETPALKRTHVPWTCVLIRAESLAEVGNLNSARFAAGLYADDEWNLRATQHGWHFLIDTNAFAAHDNESTTFKAQRLNYNQALADGRTNWLKQTNVLACVLGCERKAYSMAGVNSAKRQRWVRHVHVNFEGVGHDILDSDSFTGWNIDQTTALPTTPTHDQDQFYRLPRIVAARNMCLDIMRTSQDYTHLLFIDSDVDTKDPHGLERLLLHQLPLCGGLIHGRGEQSHAEVCAGARHPYHGEAFSCQSGSCGFQLISRPLCERYQFSWGRSRFERRRKSEDPKFCEDTQADGWGEYVIDSSVTADHVDNFAEPLTMQSIAEF